ncbi:MAG: NAD(P)/FAD-dependent oxidoreductase [Solirubrobacterales bacterium]|nr:NAD(P)/FAD-dependent oxidoreductase [Solirubrobacterales bacterium]MBV9367665.1 NAD(P)/FAD-dependent oxidoreductase [Solirubrobacterales bacterium]MBV9807123.1 NAD(P)/FAD-dependent oxidoreductase [Solirubrobacterales bacterium]
MSSSNGRHRVVIVGSGFGGLAAAKALRGAPVDVTVIDRTNHHLFQPLLYQMATGVVAEGDIAPPIRDILRHHANTRVLLGDVIDVDLDAREVTLETVGRNTSVAYDSLIVAAGAGQSYFGHDEFAEHAPGLKTIDDALEVRGRIFGAFEMAELERDDGQRDAWLTLAVVGAGPTGVEVAGQIAELSRRALTRNFRTFDPAQARVILLDAVDTVLPTFPEALRRRAHRDLRRLGVDTRLGTRVTGVDEYGLDVLLPDGSRGRIEARTKVWAAGVEASVLGSRLAAKSGATVDRSGRVAVCPDCTLPGHPEVFVIGDLMSLGGLQGVAEVAMQSGRHAARTIVRRLHGEDAMRAFRYHDLGTMATVSRFRAVASFGPVRVGGAVAWLLWLVVHLAFLTGFKNRLATLARWTIAFLGRGRPERTITEQQVFARTRTPS